MKKVRKKLTMGNRSLFIGYLIACFAVNIGCNNNHKINNDTKNEIVKNFFASDTTKKLDFESYLRNDNVSELAKDYYLGKFKPADNSETEKLLSLSLTNDTTVRPFYFWCLNEIIGSADGALMEYVGEPARRYVEKFPEEFLYYLDNKVIDNAVWITAINYSGYYDNEQSENAKAVLKNFTSALVKSCIQCNDNQIKRLKQFAQECYNE
jgi:hypothetical protein